MNDNERACDNCGQVFALYAGLFSWDTPVCEDCRDCYARCDDCEELVHRDNVYHSDDNVTLCEDCFEARWLYCEDCGDLVHADDARYDSGSYYCEDCYNDNQRSDSIHEYSYKPTPAFYGGGDDGRHYGVELEVDGGDDRDALAYDLSNRDEIYCKYDGSLDCGVEIVTHPCTLDYHVNGIDWDGICDTARGYGFLSHDTTTCGLHVHASRGLLGAGFEEQELTLAKILLLFNRHWDKLARFSRRSESRLRRWASKPDVYVTPDDTLTEILDKANLAKRYDRDSAVNCFPRDTVEFRLFRGTLKPDTILASIQLADTVIAYCKRMSVTQVLTSAWGDVWAGCGHRELANYLFKRGLGVTDDTDAGAHAHAPARMTGGGDC